MRIGAAKVGFQASVTALVVIGVAVAISACGSGGAVSTAAVPSAHVSADPCSLTVTATHHSNLRSRCQRGGEIASFERPVQPPSAKVASATCATPAIVQAYAQDDWLGLARSLAVAPVGCVEAWISVPTEIGKDGAWLTTRPHMKEAFARIGANVHPMPEVNFNDWNAWGKQHPDVSWLDRGVRARAEMEQAGYRFNEGDRWVLNEVPVGAVADSADRAAVRDLVRGLQGSSRMPTGVIYVVTAMQSEQATPSLRASLKEWFADEPFWAVMRTAAVAWSVEAYASIKSTCAPHSTAQQQVDALRDYAFFRERFAKSLTLPDEAAVRTVLQRGVPLANNAWSWADAYGYTAVSRSEMERFAALQVAAMARTLPGEDHLTIGFAWAPKRPDGVSSAAFRRDLAALTATIRDAIVNENRTDDRAATSPCRYATATLANWWN